MTADSTRNAAHAESERALLADVALEIGLRLARSAIWDGQACTWLVEDSRTQPNLSFPRVRAAGQVYSGTAGIAMFLSQLHKVRAHPEVARAMIGALTHAMTKERAADVVQIGYFTGRTGVAYAAISIGIARGLPSFVDQGRELVNSLKDQVPHNVAFDVIDGAAGAIPALLRISEMTQDESGRVIAMALGHGLLRNAVREPEGWSWRSPWSPLFLMRNFTGWAHGTSGIAGALLDLYAASGEEEFLYGAEQALRYERQFFDLSRGTWLHPRHDAIPFANDVGGMDELDLQLLEGASLPRPRPLFPNQWCYGGAGMMGVRLRMARLMNEGSWAAEAHAASRATQATLEQPGYSLCHGAAGNAECLLHAAALDGDLSLAARVAQWSDSIPERLRSGLQGWKSGRGDGGDDPSLLLGEAGLGYFCLRVADPACPSPLFLDVDARRSKPAAADWRAWHDAEYARAFFADTLERFEALGVSVELIPGDWSSSQSAPIAMYEAILRICVEHDGEMGELLRDAARIDCARLAMLRAHGDHTPERLAAHLRMRFPDVWRTGPLYKNAASQFVVTDNDWQVWLAHPAHERAARPEKLERRWLIAIAENGIIAIVADQLIKVVLSVLEEPCTLSEFLEEATAEETDDGRKDSIRASITACVRHLFNLGVLSPIRMSAEQPHSANIGATTVRP